MLTVGDKVRTHRERLGLTQLQLGQAVGVAGSTVCKIENGDSSPRVETLERMAGTFGVPLIVLLSQQVTQAELDLQPAAEVEAPQTILDLLAELDSRVAALEAAQQPVGTDAVTRVLAQAVLDQGGR